MPAFLTGYSYRIPITIDHTQVGANDLTDFPLLVKLSDEVSARLIGEIAVLGGSELPRIAFTANDGTTLIPFSFNNGALGQYQTSEVFTANAGADTITVSGRVFYAGEVILVASSGTLPGGLIPGYYWVVADATSTCQISAVKGGTPVDITSAGSGTHNLQRRRFYAADGISVLSLFVKPATISHTSDTTIYLNFDHRAVDASSGYNAASVWNSNYKGRWGLEQDPSGSAPQMLDSTSNANHGTTAGSMVSGDLVAAEIGNGLSFVASDGKYVDFGTGPRPTANMTVGVWIKFPDVSVPYSGIIGSDQDPSNNHLGFELNLYGTMYARLGNGSAAGDATDPNPPATNTWEHYAFTYDSTTIRLYRNGSQVATASFAGPLVNSSAHLSLKRWGYEVYCNAQVDELIALDSVLTADRLAFGYVNIASNSSTITFQPIEISDQVNFDAASDSGYQTSTSSVVVSVTCLGEYRYVEYTVAVLAAGVSITSVVRNGQTATTIDSKATVTSLGTVYTFGQIAPTAGTYNATVTLSGSAAAVAAAAVSFTGVDQTTPIENNFKAQATNVGAADAVVSVTTSTDADWICYGVLSDDGSIIAYTGCTQRANVTGGVGTGFTGTYGPKATAGAQTVGCTNVGALATWAICANAIRPKSAEAGITALNGYAADYFTANDKAQSVSLVGCKSLSRSVMEDSLIGASKAVIRGYSYTTGWERIASSGITSVVVLDRTTNWEVSVGGLLIDAVSYDWSAQNDKCVSRIVIGCVALDRSTNWEAIVPAVISIIATHALSEFTSWELVVGEVTSNAIKAAFALDYSTANDKLVPSIISGAHALSRSASESSIKSAAIADVHSRDWLTSGDKFTPRSVFQCYAYDRSATWENAVLDAGGASIVAGFAKDYSTSRELCIGVAGHIGDYFCAELVILEC